MAHRLEYLIIRGTGNGEPQGVVNAASAYSVSADSSGSFKLVDTSAMLQRLKLWQGRVSWAMHRNLLSRLHQFQVGTSTGSVWLANIAIGSQGNPLHGYQIDWSEHIAQGVAANCAMLVDWSAYGLFEYGPLTIDYSEHALFTSGQNVWRFDQELDGKALFQSTYKDESGFAYSPYVLFGN